MAEHEVVENDTRFEKLLAEIQENDSGQESDGDFTVDATSEMTLGIVRNTPLTKKPMLFCRDCLVPYHGESVAGGRYVLKCPECDHSDAVGPGVSMSDELDSFSSDLIMNRFGSILKQQEKLKSIDVNNPDYIEDEYRRYHYAYDFFINMMKETMNSMHKMLDDFRQKHNDEMIKRLAEEAEELKRIQKKTKQESPGLKVTITGSKETNDLIVNPDLYQVPTVTRIRCYHTGKRGIRCIDKYILEKKIYYDILSDAPLCKARMKQYCESAGVEIDYFDQFCILSNDISVPNETTNIPAKKKKRKKKKNKSKVETLKNTCDELETELVNGKGISSAKGHRLCDKNGEPCLIPTGNDSHKAKGRLAESVKKDDSPEQEKSNSASADVKPARNVLENVPDQTDNRTGSVNENATKTDAKNNETEASRVRNMKLLCDYITENYHDIGDVAEYTVPYVSEAFTEIIKTVGKFRNKALERRRKKAVQEIERTIAEMTRQVDVVKEEVVSELQDAYREKLMRTDRQEKRLRNSVQKEERCLELIDHYENTNQLDKLDALLDEMSSLQGD